MERKHQPIHLIAELRRGTKNGKAWAVYRIRKRDGGQATVIFSGTVPKPGAVGQHFAVNARCNRGQANTWFIFSDAVVSAAVAMKANGPATPERRDAMAVKAAETALRIALQALETQGSGGAIQAHLFASHALDSLSGFMAEHTLSIIPEQRFEDTDDDDGYDADEAAA